MYELEMEMAIESEAMAQRLRDSITYDWLPNVSTTTHSLRRETKSSKA